MYAIILILFIIFHLFITVFPRVVFTKNVSPSNKQLIVVRSTATLMVLAGFLLLYFYI